MPIVSNSSNVRGWRPRAREVAAGAGALSMMRQRTPRLSNSQASVRPVGPAPTIRTSVSCFVVLITLLLPPAPGFLLGASSSLRVLIYGGSGASVVHGGPSRCVGRSSKGEQDQWEQDL